MDAFRTVFIQGTVAFLVVLLLLRLTIGRFSVRAPRRARGRRIMVIGVGGAGGNAVDAMVRQKVGGAETIACNTDAQALHRSRARRKLQIGRSATGGSGTGGDPALGRLAAEEDADRIRRVLGRADLVFVVAGLGGGTGSGAAPLVARLAREDGALTVGLVTLPFQFEGDARSRVAAVAAAELRAAVDTLITIPNDRVSAVAAETASLVEAFGVADDVLCRAVETITDIIAVPGLVNLDFADLRTALTDGGPAVFGVGRSRGDGRALDAARQALASPLLEPGVTGARSILFHVAGPEDLRLSEVRQVAEEFRASADPAVDVLFGATIDRRGREEVQVTLIATGLGSVEGLEKDRGARRAAAPRGGEGETAGQQVATAPVATATADPPSASGRRKRRASASPPVASAATDDPVPGAEPGSAGQDGADAADLDVPTFLRAGRSGRTEEPAPTDLRATD